MAEAEPVKLIQQDGEKTNVCPEVFWFWEP